MSLGKSLGELLSKQDTIYLLELINFSIYCKDKKDLIKLINKLIYLTSYDFTICALGIINGSGLLQSYEIINVSYSEEWMDLYVTKKYYQVDPIIKKNFTEFKLQYWADTYKKIPPPKGFLSQAEDFGLKGGYSIGLRDLKWSRGSIFSIAGPSLEHNIRTETILTYAIPHIHQTLVRILDQDHIKKLPTLSSREIEILNWLKLGKTNWDISIILKVSERTVKFHVRNIIKKLNATNRVQAVAVAIGQGLIKVG